MATGTKETFAVPPEYIAVPRRYFMEFIPELMAEYQGAEGHFGTLDAVAQFHLTGDDGGQWYFELGNGTVEVAEGFHPKPSFTITMTVDAWRKVTAGTRSHIRSYLRGDVKFRGSLWTFRRVIGLFR